MKVFARLMDGGKTRIYKRTPEMDKEVRKLGTSDYEDDDGDIVIIGKKREVFPVYKAIDNEMTSRYYGRPCKMDHGFMRANFAGYGPDDIVVVEMIPNAYGWNARLYGSHRAADFLYELVTADS